MSSFTGAKMAKFIFGVIFIPIGVGISIHPIAGDFFNPGGRFSAPHTQHISANEMRVFGIFIAIVGLGLLYSTFNNSRK
jgi:hypothetical protein